MHLGFDVFTDSTVVNDHQTIMWAKIFLFIFLQASLHAKPKWREGGKNPHSWQIFVTFLGWLSDPFQWLSDLQLGDEKVTLNHLVPCFFSTFV